MYKKIIVMPAPAAVALGALILHRGAELREGGGEK